MSVYVDAAVDRGWKLGANAHMVADSLPELHAFARKIGLRREWFQNGTLPHYDLTVARRRAAVGLGAIEVDRRFIAERIRASREASPQRST